MTVYRMDVQLRAPWVNGPQAYYYWANSYYFDALTIDDYDYARDAALDVTSRMSNSLIRLDWFRIRVLSTGVVVQNQASLWPANTLLVGEYPALENTVYVALQIGGKQFSYKRYRSPVRKADMDGGHLTPSALLHYQTTANQLVAPGLRFCTSDGRLFDGATVSPLVHSWQMRHGTLRARRREYH